ncbi:hypothetical protein CIK04_28040 [Vibrio sp. 03_296]|nr:hypothetical protein CIK04_28040 [Vibrio sp. 03_296]
MSKKFCVLPDWPGVNGFPAAKAAIRSYIYRDDTLVRKKLRNIIEEDFGELKKREKVRSAK